MNEEKLKKIKAEYDELRINGFGHTDAVSKLKAKGYTDAEVSNSQYYDLSEQPGTWKNEKNPRFANNYERFGLSLLHEKEKSVRILSYVGVSILSMRFVYTFSRSIIYYLYKHVPYLQHNYDASMATIIRLLLILLALILPVTLLKIYFMFIDRKYAKDANKLAEKYPTK